MKDIITKFAEETGDLEYSGLTDPQITPLPTQTDLIGSVVNILNVVLGLLSIICVIVIIFGGITYMTSTGDSTKVKKGKDTILYGIIGLVICILAFAIVNFVISKIGVGGEPA